jgi:alcohol dehydrogenase (cytochrome c)
MTKRPGVVIRILLVAAALGSALEAAEERGAPVSVHMNVSPAQLLVAPPAQDWPSYNGDYTGRRFSALDQINPDNVHRLRAQWIFHAANTDTLEVTPVEIGGVMYVTSANDAFALDARSGLVLWHFSRALSKDLVDDAGGHISRGVAFACLYGNRQCPFALPGRAVRPFDLGRYLRGRAEELRGHQRTSDREG